MSGNSKATPDPDDNAALRARGERESAEFGDAIAETYAEELKGVVTLYADKDAEALLWRLRERFWALDLPKAVQRARRSR